jgi:hypothetical protein
MFGLAVLGVSRETPEKLCTARLWSDRSRPNPVRHFALEEVPIAPAWTYCLPSSAFR